MIAVTIGGLAACAIAYARRHGAWLDAGLMLPLSTSAVTVGFGFLLAFSHPPLNLRNSILLIPLAHALVAIPLVVRTVLPVLRSVDSRLRDVAATLGASPWRAWWSIDGPRAGAVAGGRCRASRPRSPSVSSARRRSSIAPSSPTLPVADRPAAVPPRRGERRDGGCRRDPADAGHRTRGPPHRPLAPLRDAGGLVIAGALEVEGVAAQLRRRAAPRRRRPEVPPGEVVASWVRAVPASPRCCG